MDDNEPQPNHEPQPDDAAEPQPDDAAEPQPSASSDDGGWGLTPSIADAGGVPAGPPSQPGPPSPPGSSAAMYPAAGARPPQPRRPVNRRVLLGVLGGALALVLVIVLGSVGYARGAHDHAPARQVEAFLDDLESGHAERALALAHVSTKGEPLLTDAVYARASDRISDYRITASSTTGGTAEVTALVTQAGRSTAQTFHLQKTGSAGVFFSNWRLGGLTLGSVQVGIEGPEDTPLTIGGASVTTKGGAVTLHALPGSYEAAIADSKWFTAKPVRARVAGFTPSTLQPVMVEGALTDAGKQAATDAVNAWVDGCVAQTTIAPTGCSFYAYGQSPDETYTNQKWTLDTRPVSDIGAWVPDGWLVRTTTPGSATYTADFTSAAGRGTGTAGPITFYVDGYITGFTDAGATFRSAVTSDAGGSASS